MVRFTVVGLVLALVFTGFVLAEETVGSITKIEDRTITLQPGGGGGFGMKKEKAEPKTLKIARDAKIFRVVGKDKEEVKLTLDELKTAVKVTNIFVTAVHEGETVSEIRVGFTFGGKGKGKKKKDD